MSAGRRGVAFTPLEVRPEVIERAARLAEDLGYEVFSVAEGGGSTRWRCCPGSLAQGLHGARYAQPARRLREVTVAVRALLAGEPAPVPRHPAARPVRLAAGVAVGMPVWIAATGRWTVPVAAELADGWYPFLLGPRQCREWTDGFAGAGGAVRARPRPLTVATGPFTVAGPDQERARALAGACVTRYLTGMGDGYPQLVAAQGFGAEVELVRAATVESRGDSGAVPAAAQTLLDEFTAHGPAERVQERLRRWDAAVDIAMVVLPPGISWPVLEATLRAAAPGDATTPPHRLRAPA